MNGGWGEYLLAFVVFVLAHTLPTRPAIRGRLTALVGERSYLVGYSIASLLLLYWLLRAAGGAPVVMLWGFAPWQLWVPNLIMPIVVLLAAAGIAVANPFSIGGSAGACFDADRPGITAISRHPLLLAMALCALAHVVPNGTLAHVLLFGLLADFSGLGMVVLDHRRRRLWGEQEFAVLARNTTLWPGALRSFRRFEPLRSILPPRRLVAAVAIYVGLLLVHPVLFGVSPLPLF